jgi:hypothetical protein
MWEGAAMAASQNDRLSKKAASIPQVLTFVGDIIFYAVLKKVLPMTSVVSQIYDGGNKEYL